MYSKKEKSRNLFRELNQIFEFCFLTPANRCETEFVLKFSFKFCLTFFAIFVYSLFHSVAYGPAVPEPLEIFVRAVIVKSVFTPLLENASMWLFCRCALKMKWNGALICVTWGLLFGGIHIAKNGPLAAITIVSFMFQAGMYLNWYQTKNAYLITVIFHGLSNFSLEYTERCLVNYFG